MPRIARLLLLALLAAPPGLAAERLTVVDISAASAQQVERLKQLPADAWWLEMGDQLVIYGDAAAKTVATAASPVLARRDNVDATLLRLRAKGCSEHSIERGRVLAQGGRWELREIASHELDLLQQDHAGSWIAVPRNATLARQYRLDSAAKGAAPDPNVQQVVDRIDAARWFGDVQMLTTWDRSSYGGASLVAARDWIASRFTALGLDTSLLPFQMSSPGGTITRHNVLGRWVGASQPDRWVIVGAHYDSRNATSSSTSNTPGAEDNASGCAGVIELARALIPSQPARSILFMCYAGEEQGLHGSNAHAQSLIQSGDASKVDLVVIMDMIGYSADAQLEALFESYETHQDYLDEFGAAAATYVPELDVVISTHPFGSDHMPYLDAGLRTALAIENDWDDYPHYHRSTDTPANLGPHAQGMGGAILKTNAALIADLGGLAPPLPPPFRDGFEEPPPP